MTANTISAAVKSANPTAENRTKESLRICWSFKRPAICFALEDRRLVSDWSKSDAMVSKRTDEQLHYLLLFTKL
jgi:hypothetical protein